MERILGIDVGKDLLHAVLLQGERTARKSVNNNTEGFEQLRHWLVNRKATRVHACLEATGCYGEGIAEFLYDDGHIVSIANPSQVKAFAKSELARSKTDAIDAAIIARFCKANDPPPWQPPPQEMRIFRAMMRRRETLSAMITAEQNRLSAATSDPVRRSIRAVMKALKSEMRQLEQEIDNHVDSHPGLRDLVQRLDDIPGFGPLTAMKVVAETNGFTVCTNAKQIAAFAGLNPCLYESGSIRRRGRISKIGNAALRKALFYAALSAARGASYFRAFVERLRAAGKRPKVVITALMRKMLVLAFTLAKTGAVFNPALGA